MITLQRPTEILAREAEARASHFLFIASDYKPWPGGIAAYLDTLARTLMSLGDTVKILAVVRPEEEERIAFLKTYEQWVTPFPVVHDRKPTNWLGRKCVSLLEIIRCLSPGCRHALQTMGFFSASTASIETLEQALLDERPTATVLGHLDVSLYPLALSLIGRQQPYVLIAHGSEIGTLPNHKKNDFIKKRVMLKGASWIAANSRHTKSLLEMWNLPSERIKIVYPPIPAEVMREAALWEPALKEDSELNIATICRLVNIKGIDVALRALKILVERGIPCRFVVGGDGPERGSLAKLVDELGLKDRVHFAGPVIGEEKWQILRNADVFVMPSRGSSKIEQEGFGIVFIEAAAFGIPAIGSNTGGISDAILDNETGLLVPTESASALAEALTFLYRNPETRRRMGRAGRERAVREFSPRAVATQFKEEVAKARQQL
jgi:phosphatidyl-myo-inositol dimannoside synthase